MKVFVLDCSVTMSWCFSDEANAKADKVLSHIKELKAIVPSIWSLEIMNVLWVSEKKKRITASQANTFMSLLSSLPIEMDANANDISNHYILEISRKHNISAYDAAYLELAIRRQIPLFSFDKLLCHTATKAGVSLFK